MVSQIAAGSSASGYPDVYVAGFLLGNCHGLFAWRISFIVKKRPNCRWFMAVCSYTDMLVLIFLQKNVVGKKKNFNFACRLLLWMCPEAL